MPKYQIIIEKPTFTYYMVNDKTNCISSIEKQTYFFNYHPYFATRKPTSLEHCNIDNSDSFCFCCCNVDFYWYFFQSCQPDRLRVVRHLDFHVLVNGTGFMPILRLVTPTLFVPPIHLLWFNVPLD